MKKTIAIFVLALFLISLVPVFALENNQTQKQGKDIKNGLKDKREEIKKEIKDKREEIKNKVDELKNKIRDIKEEYKTQKENINNKVDEVKKSCGGGNKTKCDNVKQTFFVENVKPHLINAIDLIQDNINKRIDRINLELNNTKIQNPEDLNAALDELNGEIVKLDSLKIQVKAATTKEQIKDLNKQVRKEWKQAKSILEKSRGNILTHRFAFAIEKSESLQKKLDSVLEKMKASGQDISTVQTKVDSFKTHITKSKDLVEQAKAKFASADGADKDTVVKDAHSLLVQAQKEFQAAHDDLKDIVQAIKAKGGVEKDLEGNETAAAQA